MLSCNFVNGLIFGKELCTCTQSCSDGPWLFERVVLVKGNYLLKLTVSLRSYRPKNFYEVPPEISWNFFSLFFSWNFHKNFEENSWYFEDNSWFFLGCHWLNRLNFMVKIFTKIHGNILRSRWFFNVRWWKS